MRNDGVNYEEHINKFFKGTNVSNIHNYCDIETKSSLYEVKGCKIYLENKTGSMSLGRYQINFDNHKQLKQEADKLNKKAKYVFLLRIDRQKIFKTMSWLVVNHILLLEGREFKKEDSETKMYNIRLRSVW